MSNGTETRHRGLGQFGLVGLVGVTLDFLQRLVPLMAAICFEDFPASANPRKSAFRNPWALHSGGSPAFLAAT